jgi:hypothetical protein
MPLHEMALQRVMTGDKDKPLVPRAPSAGEGSKLAKGSCFAGILGLMGLAAVPPPLVLILGVIAIICGHVARRRIRMTSALTGGSGMALAGLILGYTSVYLAVSDRGNDRVLNRARTVSTLATTTALESAVNSFHIEYDKLPDVANRITTNSPQGVELLHILLGLKENSTNPQNSRQIKFLSIREGKNRKNGLVYSESGDSVDGLFDPWGKPYTVILDTDHDELLRFKIADKDVELKGRRVAVFSPGADQKEGTDDDIQTW